MYNYLHVSSPECGLPASMSSGGFRASGCPRAAVPSDLCWPQQRDWTQPARQLPDPWPQLLLSHPPWHRYNSSWHRYTGTALSQQWIIGPNFGLLAENPQSCVIHITQLERDTVLVCMDRKFNKTILFWWMYLTLNYFNDTFLIWDQR